MHSPLISIRSVFKECWHAIPGSKLPFFLGFLCLIAIELILVIVKPALSHLAFWLNSAIFLLVPTLITAPLFAGLAMTGVKHLQQQPLQWSSTFKYYRSLPKFFIAFLLSIIILWLVLLMLGLSAIVLLNILHVSFHLHLSFAPTFTISLIILALLFGACKSLMLFTLLLVADQNKNPLTAWWSSVMMAWPHFGKILLSIILFSIIDLLSLILMGVGLIWSIPLTYLVIARLYLLCKEN